MFRRFAFGAGASALLVAAVLAAPPGSQAHSHKKKGLEIVHPWTLAMVDKSAKTASVFMTIRNRGAGDRLLGASTPLAAKVELREPSGDGSADTRPAAAIVIAAGKDLDLNRGGPRLLLDGVRKPLNAFDSFRMTLVFEKAGKLVVEVVVEEADTTEPAKH